MGGWSGGVYTRFRNWVTDKANSINPQAALFDQEDDGFAAGLNNCVTKDGLNKPSSAMDWNGQSLTGVLNFANSGTLINTGVISVSLLNGKLAANATANWTIGAPSSGIALTVNGLVGSYAQQWTDGTRTVGAFISASAPNVQFGSVTNHALGFFTNNGTPQAQLLTTGILQAIDQASAMQDVGWRDCPQNSVSGNYTLALSDRGKQIAQQTAAATVTIPANASIAFPVGSSIVIFNNSAGNISIAITTDVLFIAATTTTGTRTLASNGLATIMKTDATHWVISGSGLS
jgi:hypothetical protein